MAVPRLFVSSTYYDLRYVRSDLDILKDQMGIEIVRFEEGSIPYHTADTLPEACCKEIENCQILALIIGGRYGSTVVVKAEDDQGDDKGPERSISISRLEAEHAIRSGLIIFTFVDAGVFGEHRTYQACSKAGVTDVVWATVDDVAVFEFIDFIRGLPGQNPIFEFRTPREIQDLLRKQLSGHFFDLLQGGKMAKFGTHLQQLKTATEQFIALEQNLREQESKLKEQLEKVSAPDHEFFQKLQDQLVLDFPVFIRSADELSKLLSHVGFDEPVDLQEKPDWNMRMKTFKNSVSGEYFAISKALFREDGTLVLPTKWDANDIWRGKVFPKIGQPPA